MDDATAALIAGIGGAGLGGVATTLGSYMVGRRHERAEVRWTLYAEILAEIRNGDHISRPSFVSVRSTLRGDPIRDHVPVDNEPPLIDRLRRVAIGADYITYRLAIAAHEAFPHGFPLDSDERSARYATYQLRLDRLEAHLADMLRPRPAIGWVWWWLMRLPGRLRFYLTKPASP